MAGLSHNPDAYYCTKHVEGERTEEGAVCEYCKARGLAPEGSTEPEEADIVRFFRLIGLVKDAALSLVVTKTGVAFRDLTIVDLHGFGDTPDRAVLTFRELGISGHPVRIPYASISHWRSA